MSDYLPNLGQEAEVHMLAIVEYTPQDHAGDYALSEEALRKYYEDRRIERGTSLMDAYGPEGQIPVGHDLMPEELLWCEIHTTSYLEPVAPSTVVEVGARVRQFKSYPAFDSTDNPVVGVVGTLKKFVDESSKENGFFCGDGSWEGAELVDIWFYDLG